MNTETPHDRRCVCLIVKKPKAFVCILTGIFWAAFAPMESGGAKRLPVSFTETHEKKKKRIPRGNKRVLRLCHLHRSALPQEKLQQKNKMIKEAGSNTK